MQIIQVQKVTRACKIHYSIFKSFATILLHALKEDHAMLLKFHSIRAAQVFIAISLKLHSQEERMKSAEAHK